MKSKVEMELWAQINSNFMTDESENSDSVFQHSLEWRDESESHDNCNKW